MSDAPAPFNLDALHGLRPSAVAQALAAHTGPGLLAALAARALDDAENDVAQAQCWLDAADLLGGASDTPSVDALLQYARARTLVHLGNLAAAEESLRSAQGRWRAAGDVSGETRAFLGLTQVLAMQGRYADAEDSARAAIARLETSAAPEATLRLAGAHQNLATLFHYQDRHADALAEYGAAAAILESVRQNAAGHDPERAAEVESMQAHNALNRAGALTFLDRYDDAASVYDEAIAHFTAQDDTINRGRARTNLGRLRLRTGDYATAMATFELAADDLLGTRNLAEVPDGERLRVADELLLEHGFAYLALNLLPEAEAVLARAEALFRPAGMRYELAQTLYALALAKLRGPAPAEAAEPLAEALALFDALENRYGAVRTRTALAILSQTAGDHAQAAEQLDVLLAMPVAPDASAMTWDALARADALLLRGFLHAEAGELAAARVRAAEVAAPRGKPAQAEAVPLLPQIAIRYHHLVGRVARLEGDTTQARRELQAAITLLEGQRATLPLEEVRTAYLEDKGAVYADLLLALLDSPQPSSEEVSAAFEAVERARSRALLERLLSTLDVQPRTQEGNSSLDEVRRRLHWLYNALLGEGGSRSVDAARQEMVRALFDEESRVSWWEQRQSLLLGQAKPVTLAEFQTALGSGRHALVYTTTGSAPGDEVLAFVVDRDQVRVVRRLCTVGALHGAHAELRFQLGRAALGSEYLSRHAARLSERLRSALKRIYQLAVEPLRPLLTTERLLVVPAAALHSVPMHALWDGGRYLIESFEISVAPSASVALIAGAPRAPSGVDAQWAGLALTDAAIPAARAEVEASALYFGGRARLYLDGDASLAELRVAAQANILHIATHGLFRSDNPYFSVLKLADGWIDVRELYRLPLAAQLVVLSACESGVGQVRAGEEVIGLTRGFLAAGASNVVASIWHVHDASAARLMEHFYAALTADAATAVRPAAALRAAQRTAISEGQHPYFWAPFYVTGS